MNGSYTSCSEQWRKQVSVSLTADLQQWWRTSLSSLIQLPALVPVRTKFTSRDWRHPCRHRHHRRGSVPVDCSFATRGLEGRGRRIPPTSAPPSRLGKTFPFHLRRTITARVPQDNVNLLLSLIDRKCFQKNSHHFFRVWILAGLKSPINTIIMITSERRHHNVEMYDARWSWPLTSDLKTFSAIPTHMMNVCGEFHSKSHH